MPSLFHTPIDRRSFLRITSLGAATIATLTPGSLSGAAASGEEFHLALLSDTHLPGDRKNGYRGFNPWENLKRIVPDVVASKPEGMLLCGDAARLSGLPQDYIELKSVLEPISAVAPAYIGLGNHDNRAEFLKVFSPVPDQRETVKNKHIMVIEHPVLRIVLLDSLLYVNEVAGLLGKEQRQWLTDYLPDHADRPVVLFVHHTLGDGDGDLLDAERMFDILLPNRHVKAIFYGHSHVWEQTERQGIQLINLPAVGYNFRDADPVGWVQARFQSNGVDLTLRAIGGNTAGDGEKIRVQWS
ncbi:MAG: metallophosphoesterase [Verrucomicrobia bacterium]|nr:metallophosphoesterase [Verrucomicrobiota bacterium]